MSGSEIERVRAAIIVLAIGAFIVFGWSNIGSLISRESKAVSSVRSDSFGAASLVNGRYVTFQMAEVAIPRQLFAEIMQRIAALRSPPMATAT